MEWRKEPQQREQHRKRNPQQINLPLYASIRIVSCESKKAVKALKPVPAFRVNS
jgi:hypothetical protein